MPPVLVHAYPWDLDGPTGAAERAVQLGVTAVAVAASYHATRAAAPLHPTRPLVEAAHAALYVPVRPAAWAGRRLTPLAPTWVSSQDAFGDARQALAQVGLQTHAWLVLTHNSALGRAHPDLVVRNAFGDAYRYALCPSAPDVVEYCATLVDEVLAAGPVDGVVLEACGPMGLDHNGLHEKTALAGWDAVQRQLLSLCFCAACVDRLVAVGVDVDDLAHRVRSGVTSASSPGSVEQALGEQLAAAVTAVRQASTGELRRRVLGASARPGVRVTLHADPDPWSTGSFAPVPTPLPETVDALVTDCSALAAGAAALPGLRASGGPDVALGAVVRPTAAWADDAGLRADLDALRRAGLQELHLYHLGLVGAAGHEQLRRLSAAFRGA